MATKAKGSIKKKTTASGTSASAATATEPMTLAYDPVLLNEFVLGNITLGELEGVGKEAQYQIAERGYKLLNEGKIDDAEKIFKGLISLDPFDSYFHTVLGSIYQRRNRKDEAIEEYSRALKVNPFNPSALANRGEIYFQQGRVLEATQDFQSAIENDPDGSEPATVRCRVLAMALAKTIEENKDKIMATVARTKTKRSDKVGEGDGKKKSAKKATKKTGKKR